MKGKFTLILIFTLILLISAFANVKAAVNVNQITGTLGGAHYLIRIPDNWNGELIVGCRGYSHLLSSVNLELYANIYNSLITGGYAFAESDYGAQGYCVKEAIIRTHQLTEWVINNYHVTGHVYLIGISMGGNTALELGAKYPDLYSGVLDIAGSKDIKVHYSEKVAYSSLKDDTALAAAVIANGGVNPP
jgi:hypothetical protein